MYRRYALIVGVTICLSRADEAQSIGYDPNWASTAGADTLPATMTVPAANRCDRWASPNGTGDCLSSPGKLTTCVSQLGGSTQVLCLQAGTYTLSSSLRPAGSGTASAPLVIRKDPAAPNPASKPTTNTPCTLNAGRVIVQYTGSSWSFINFGGSDGSARNYWVVEGIDFDLNHKNTGGIILPEQSQGLLLRNSVIHNSSGISAVRIAGDDAQVINNCIYDNFDAADAAKDIHGVSIVGVDTRNGGATDAVPERVRVARNWIYDAQGDGIHCNDGSAYDWGYCIPENDPSCTPNLAGPPNNLWLEDNRIFTTAANQGKTENAVDIKSCIDVSIRGTGDPRKNQPDSKVAQNKYSGFRKKTTEPGTKGGGAVVVHLNAKQILIENTRIWNSGGGIGVGRDILRFDKGTAEKIVIKNNVVFNICSASDCSGTGIDILKAKYVDVFDNTIDNVPAAAIRFATWDQFNERSYDLDFWNNVIRSDGTYWIDTNRSLIDDCESGYNLFWGTGATPSTPKFRMSGGGCGASGSSGGLTWWQTCDDGDTLLVADDIGVAPYASSVDDPEFDSAYYTSPTSPARDSAQTGIGYTYTNWGGPGPDKGFRETY